MFHLLWVAAQCMVCAGDIVATIGDGNDGGNIIESKCSFFMIIALISRNQRQLHLTHNLIAFFDYTDALSIGSTPNRWILYNTTLSVERILPVDWNYLPSCVELCFRCSAVRIQMRSVQLNLEKCCEFDDASRFCDLTGHWLCDGNKIQIETDAKNRNKRTKTETLHYRWSQQLAEQVEMTSFLFGVRNSNSNDNSSSNTIDSIKARLA